MLAHSNPQAVVAQATFVLGPEAMKALVPKIIGTHAAETLSHMAIPARYVSASVSDFHAYDNRECRLLQLVVVGEETFAHPRGMTLLDMSSLVVAMIANSYLPPMVPTTQVWYVRIAAI